MSYTDRGEFEVTIRVPDKFVFFRNNCFSHAQALELVEQLRNELPKTYHVRVRRIVKEEC